MLVLELRYMNSHPYKEKMKSDDWKSFQNYLEGSKGCLFKFDLKNRYNHIGMFNKHQTFLRFSWEINKKNRYFVFTVLTFGFSTFPVYQSGHTTNKVLAPTGYKNSLFFR